MWGTKTQYPIMSTKRDQEKHNSIEGIRNNIKWRGLQGFHEEWNEDNTSSVHRPHMPTRLLENHKSKKNDPKYPENQMRPNI